MKARKAEALPHKKREVVRRYVAVDIENINGGSVRDTRRADEAFQAVAAAVQLADGEQVVIGVGPSSLLASAVVRPRARMVMGRGINGADHALIEVLSEERMPQRFNAVVIASGDGIFASVAADLAAAGLEVTVVAREGHLSARLRLAAQRVVLLLDAPSLGEAA